MQIWDIKHNNSSRFAAQCFWFSKSQTLPSLFLSWSSGSLRLCLACPMASSKTRLQEQGIQRRELQAAIAKAVELREIHAALLRGGINGPAAASLLAGASTSLSRFSPAAEDYPVFTPVSCSISFIVILLLPLVLLLLPLRGNWNLLSSLWMSIEGYLILVSMWRL